jgi:hypothetical protein
VCEPRWTTYRNPTTPQNAAGIRSEPPRSDPVATHPIPAASDAAAPPDDPGGRGAKYGQESAEQCHSLVTIVSERDGSGQQSTRPTNKSTTARAPPARLPTIYPSNLAKQRSGKLRLIRASKTRNRLDKPPAVVRISTGFEVVPNTVLNVCELLLQSLRMPVTCWTRQRTRRPTAAHCGTRDAKAETGQMQWGKCRVGEPRDCATRQVESQKQKRRDLQASDMCCENGKVRKLHRTDPDPNSGVFDFAKTMAPRDSSVVTIGCDSVGIRSLWSGDPTFQLKYDQPPKEQLL